MCDPCQKESNIIMCSRNGPAKRQTRVAVNSPTVKFYTNEQLPLGPQAWDTGCGQRWGGGVGGWDMGMSGGGGGGGVRERERETERERESERQRKSEREKVRERERERR